MQEPRIEILQEKKLVGKRLMMSFAENGTGELWKSFMPLRKQIHDPIGNDLFSVQVYPPGFFDHFNPTVIFEKRAAVEVKGFNSIPAGMETFIIPGGLYAVFSTAEIPIRPMMRLNTF
ncbi:MAG: GyrI-like domain-containing protein [Ferruginibacter sp.]